MKFGVYSHVLSIFLLFLLLSSISAAETAADEPGLEGREMKKIASSGVSMGEKMEGSADMINLMGEEACDDGEEECLKGRLMSEAHLDYIYTQQHKH